MKISELLQAYTKLNGIGVRDIAFQIGVSPATVSRMETGKEISGSSMIKVMRWLFEKDEPPKVEVWDLPDKDDLS